MKVNFQVIWTCDANFTMRVLPTLHPGALGSPIAPDAFTAPSHIYSTSPAASTAQLLQGCLQHPAPAATTPSPCPTAAREREKELFLEKGLGSQMLPLRPLPGWRQPENL